jgi:hypothetical protein
MVAVAQYIPTDPEEKESVLAVLREHPEVEDFVQRASEKAKETFPEFSITLDTVRYDEWDPPVSMTIRVVQLLDAFEVAYEAYMRWLVSSPDYPRDFLFVMPTWDGPLEDQR